MCSRWKPCSVPSLAPVDGGAKVTAQARAWQWPVIVAAGQATDRELVDTHWDWCLSAAGRHAAAAAARCGGGQVTAMLTELIADLHR
jgi:hypothetical protein